MANSYYNHGSFPATGSAGSSLAMRTELDAITAGFNLLPTLAGNGNALVKINPGGTSQTVATVLADDGAFGYVNGLKIGYLGIPQNSQSASYTAVLGDAGKHLYHPTTDTSARTWTIPANASVPFDIGTSLTFINDLGAGTITIAINSDTLVFAPAGTTGSRTLAASGVATAIKVTSTRWVISGSGIS